MDSSDSEIVDSGGQGIASLLSVLVPELDDPLGLLIFALMVAILLAAIIAAFQARWRAGTPEAKERAERGEAAANYTSQWVAFAETAPALLIVVGLLGTFIGIAAAIVEARDALRVAQSDLGALTENLSNMLGSIGVKFRSSAWGLLGSLVLRPITFAIVLRQRARAVVCDQAVRVDDYRRLSKRVGELATYSEKFLPKLETLDGLLKMSGDLSEAANAMGQSSASMAGSAATLHGSLGNFSSDVRLALQNTTKGVGVALASMGNAFTQALEGLSEALQRTARSIEEKTVAAAAEVSGMTSEASAQVVDALAGARTDFHAELERLATRFDECTNRNSRVMQETALQIKSTAEGGAARIEKATAKTASEFETNIAALRQMLSGEIKEMARTSKDAASKIEASVSANKEALQSSLGGMLSKLEGVLDDLKASFEEATKMLDESTGQNSESIGRALAGMTDQVGTMNTILVRLEAFSRESTEINNDLRDVVVALRQELGHTQSSMAKAAKLFEKIALRMQPETAHVAEASGRGNGI